MEGDKYSITMSNSSGSVLDALLPVNNGGTGTSLDLVY